MHGRHAGAILLLNRSQICASHIVTAHQTKVMSANLLNFVVYSDIVGNYWADSPLSMLPIYQELIAAGLRIWVYRQVCAANFHAPLCSLSIFFFLR